MPIVKGIKIKKKNPKVTCVIAAYNEENHLRTCINSLLNQSYKNMEIFIVENGESKDKTYEIAKEYSKKYKRVRAFSIPGKQKGPGNAWYFGFKKSNADIVTTSGADLIYGENYIKDGIKPIVRGESPGIIHNEEKCKNMGNWWARAFFKIRRSVNSEGLSKIFSIVERKYVLKRPPNPDLGYADDQTIYMTEGTEFPGVDLDIYHTNPDSLKDTWDHSLWVGRSIKRKDIIIAMLPLFPLYALYKTAKHLVKEDFYPPFIFFLPIYYSIRYFAYFKEAVNYYSKNS